MGLRLGDRDRVQEPQVARLVTHRVLLRGGRSDPTIQPRAWLRRQNGTGVWSAGDRRHRQRAPLGSARDGRRGRAGASAPRRRPTSRRRRCSRPTHDNEAAWAEWRFVPRVGRDVASVSTSIELLGRDAAAPILLAPCAFAGHAHPDGEFAVARAAATAGTTFVVSSASTVAPADVARRARRGHAGSSCTFRASHEQLAPTLAGAAEAGFTAVVVTVDAPVGSIRLHGYVPDRGFVDPMLRARPHASPLNPSVTWSTLERIVELTPLPVLVKGVLHPDDARAADRRRGPRRDRLEPRRSPARRRRPDRDRARGDRGRGGPCARPGRRRDPVRPRRAARAVPRRCMRC